MTMNTSAMGNVFPWQSREFIYTMTTPTLNIIGTGRVGQTLGALWAQKRLISLQGLYSRSEAHAVAAAVFLGQGTPVTDLAALKPADITLITTTDDAIEPTCEALVRAGAIQPKSLVIHCSGALRNGVLSSARAQGATILSAHPLKNFASPELAVESFENTYCTLEGDLAAIEQARPYFEQIGGRVIRVPEGKKTLYHAAAVLACSGLTALIDASTRLCEACEISPDDAMEMLIPFLQETLDNNRALGPKAALTGPAARGDIDVIRKHIEAIGEETETGQTLYESVTEYCQLLAERG